jgi:hypothetical protein
MDTGSSSTGRSVTVRRRSPNPECPLVGSTMPSGPIRRAENEDRATDQRVPRHRTPVPRRVVPEFIEWATEVLSACQLHALRFTQPENVGTESIPPGSRPTFVCSQPSNN